MALGYYHAWVPVVFSPMRREALSAVGLRYDLTETGNRAWKAFGTQGKRLPTSPKITTIIAVVIILLSLFLLFHCVVLFSSNLNCLLIYLFAVVTKAEACILGNQVHDVVAGYFDSRKPL